MSVLGNSLLLGAEAAGPTAYQVSRSLRFNSADSAYLSRTPASAGNRKTWTWAGWMKRSGLTAGDYVHVFGQDSIANYTVFLFKTGADSLQFWINPGLALETANLLRDPSAWYHIVLAVDTTQATASNRVKIYINGTEATYAVDSRSSITQNADTLVNSTNVHSIASSTFGRYFNGYLADIHFIDGQALTPSSFTEVSATTGQLIPKAYTGTFGTNGFWLKFSDNSNNTAATLGKDYSPNGNNWTPNNLSVTAGAGNDSLVDTPTSYGTDDGLGGSVRGNYATWNPLWNKDGATLSNGNLDYTTTTSTAQRPVYGSIPVSSGKWYWEITRQCTKGMFVGIMSTADNYITAIGPGYTANSYAYYAAGTKWNNSAGVAYGASYANGDVIGVALDLDNGRIFFSKNGTWQASGNPATGANPAFSSLSGTFVAALSEDGQSGSSTGMVANFGQRPFAYTAPSGFKALVDTNLPAPVIAKPSTVMDVKLYTGNGSTQTISGLGFNPDLVWIKLRSQTGYYHILTDSVRGTNKQLFSNDTLAEESRTDRLTAFNSDGFSLGSYIDVNLTSGSQVAWAWDAGSSTVTNTQGSITSTFRASASAGFSIISFTGNETVGATLGHGLGAKPGFAIFKDRNSSTRGFYCYHSSLGATQSIQLSSTAAASASSSWFNNTEPNSTIFTLANNSVINGASSMICWAWAPVAGYSSFGSYTGNGSTNGPFVFLGFRPRWVLIKSTSTTGWAILDAARNTYNLANSQLFPHGSEAELTSPDYFTADFLSNGFKLRTTNSASNTNGQAYIYVAFAESPLQYSRAR